MDIGVIRELIGELGFPMVMVGYFIWDKTKVTNKLVESNTSLKETITALIHSQSEITTAINNNTQVISRVLEVLHIKANETEVI